MNGTNDSSAPPDLSVIIIGGGFSGVAMACQLKRKFAIDDYCIFDRMESLGGTWAANTYPGCAVDIPGICYSLSFAPNPEFSEWFPSQAEILAYLTSVSHEYGVDKHFIGRTEWQDARWQSDKHTWLVKFKDLHTGREFTRESRVLISAVGGVVNPRPFKMPGIESFQGEVVHTARWRPDIDITDKNIVVIGNGASAVQLVPAIAGKAKSVTQFMRTPHHIVPSCNYQISSIGQKLLRYIPGLLFLLRFLMLLYMESGFWQFKTDNSQNLERLKSVSASREYIQDTAPAKYWDLLLPSYEFGCKRRVFDQGYATTLHRDNVDLTDDPIQLIQQDSVTTRSGKTFAADMIILATGFELTQYDTQLFGRNGKTRNMHWNSFGYKSAYQAVAMHGFPNFFYVLGPNSARAHTSTILSIERCDIYVELIIQLITPIIEYRESLVEVNAESEIKFNRDVQAALQQLVHDKSCSTWFIDKKSGNNWFIYPWTSLQLWLSTNSFLVNFKNWKYDRLNTTGKSL